VPGTSGPVTNADQAREFVQQHGTPIILKAAYGGGGRGMRRVDKAEDVRVSHATIPFLDSGRRGLSTRVLRGASRLRGWVVVRGEVRRTAETHRSAVARYVSRD
jgi:carbamoylphosphate synthase large subunit